MADACPISQLEIVPGDLNARAQDLERQLEAQRRVNEILIKRIAKSVDIEGGAFSLHEQNTQLQHSVEERNRQLETINRQLRQEIAERKMIEQALRVSEERYRFLMEESQQPFVVARDYEFIYANPAAAQLFGYDSPGDLLRAGLVAVVPPEERAARRKRFEMRVLGEEADHRYESRFQCRDGRIIWCEVNARVGEFEGGVAVLAGLHDITDRKHAAAELALSNSTLHATLEATADAILVVDSDLRISNYNAKFPALWQLDSRQLVGQDHLEILQDLANQLVDPEAFIERTQAYYKKGAGHTFDVLEFTDGRVYERISQPHMIERNCIGRVWSFRDVTERVKAEEMKQQLESQLRQSQKMEAIGTLAGGIAHDFNNILYAIQGYAELVMDNLPAGSIERRDQQEVLTASKRAADLVRQILAFSRQNNAQNTLVDLPATAREVLRLVRASLPSTIEMRFEQQEEELLVLADTTQMHQILMNLCTNAAHALGDEGGLLTVTLGSEVLTPGSIQPGAKRSAGSYVVISVEDSGCGMSSEVMERIFDPFFTTKEVGVGTGLGLSTVHGIVTALGGQIEVHSELGNGAQFRIYLPRAEGRLAERAVESHASLHGSGRILFVEDEEAIARMCGEALGRYGYTVETFTSSPEAWRRFNAAPLEFDLVITDQTMPDLTGSKLAEQILAVRPGMPIILCTGFSKTVTASTAKALGVFALLEKPIGIRDLAMTVATALSQAQPVPVV